MNPYLPQQTQAVTDQFNQNWRQNMLPSINTGAVANNNFGSNRHAIAQGVGMANAQTGLNNTIANMNMGAWESDQNRAHQASMQQAALAQQAELARMSDATNRLGINNQFTLGQGNLALGNKQADNSYNLGLGGLDFNYWNAGNQFGLQNKSLAQQAEMARMADATNRLGINNQFTLGQGNLALGNKQADNSYNLGQGNLALGNKQADNSYNLGLGGLDYNYWNAGNQFGLQNKSLDQGFYNANRGMDLQQMGLGANLMNQGNLGLSNAGQGMFGIGQQQQQQSFQPLQNFGSLLGQFSGLGGTNNTTQPGGSQLGGAIGGAMTLAQLWKLLSGG